MSTPTRRYPEGRLEVVSHPAPVLLGRARTVTVFDEELVRFCDAMIETMYRAGGVGLAAPQVGVASRIFVADDGEGDGPRVFVNPHRVTASARIPMSEGCLSLPGRYCSDVPRPLWVELTWVDLDGTHRRERIEGFLAHIVDHEIDHLHGVLYPHLLPPDQQAVYLATGP